MDPEIPDSVFLEGIERRETIEHRLRNQAIRLAQELAIEDPDSTFEAMEFMWSRYSMEVRGDSGIENASAVREELLLLAARANELRASIQHLGQGSIEILNLSSSSHALWTEAEVAALPSRDPYGPACETEDTSVERGGQWVIRLRALAELAWEQQRWVGRLTSKGGNKSLAPLLRKASSIDALAEDCIRYVFRHEGATQAIALRMMQAIMGAEHYVPGRRDSAVSISGEAGRAALRKAYQRLVQTQGE